MSDELATIKQRVAERRKTRLAGNDEYLISSKVHEKTEADLDRAIAGWEQYKNFLVQQGSRLMSLLYDMHYIEKERDQARAELGTYLDGSALAEARADVLKARDVVSGSLSKVGNHSSGIQMDWFNFLADTEHYEESR